MVISDSGAQFSSKDAEGRRRKTTPSVPVTVIDFAGSGFGVKNGMTSEFLRRHLTSRGYAGTTANPLFRKKGFLLTQTPNHGHRL